ncbi:MAG: 50S ribosomal protein L22 [Myxococcales bacterium FL481]|nr:MAG: 50S ribosomal protein L22 [Myxococcales bacterium FL481]
MAVARLRHLSISPRKLRIIANMIRGKSVVSSINSLRFMNKSGAREFFKLLVSAVANAEDQGGSDIDELVVSKVWVDAGPVSRRWRPRAMGRGNRIERKTSHIYLELGATEAGAQ